MSESCISCGSLNCSQIAQATDFEYQTSSRTFELFRCQNCGLVRVHPRTPSHEIAALYPATYYTVNPASPLYLQGMIYREKIRRDVTRIRGYLGESRRDQKEICVVDLGCGDAARLFELGRETRGTQVKCVGLDISFKPEVLAEAEKSQVTLVQSNLEMDGIPLPDGSVDLFILSQLIEHLCDPERVLRLMHSKLKPGGRILIETPNPGGADFTLFSKKYWGGYHVPRHFFLFTPRNLRDLVERAGLHTVRSGFLPSPGFWIISLRNWLGMNSARRGNSIWEFVNFSNLLVVGFFTTLDTLRKALGLPTSNQFILAERR